MENKRKGMPLGLYAALVVVYNILLGRFVWKTKLDQPSGSLSDPSKRPVKPEDVLLLGIGTHKLSRILTKDLVTMPIRKPFTRFEDFLGYGEVQEAAVGTGLRQVIGEMVSCNYCADVWVGLAFLYALDRSPVKTKLILKFLSSIALADFLHVFYEGSRTRANVLTLREEKLERQEKRAS